MEQFKSNIDNKVLEDLKYKITNGRIFDWGRVIMTMTCLVKLI